MADRQDSFDRSDSTTSLGTPSDSGSDWTSNIGIWGIASNKGYCPMPDVTNTLATLESSLADVEVQATLSTLGNEAGVAARQSGNSWLIWRYKAADTSTNLVRWDGASFTDLGSYSAALSAGAVLKMRCVGDSVKGYVDGVERVSVTETQNQAATAHGLWNINDSSARWDDFSITAVSGSGGPRRALLGVGK